MTAKLAIMCGLPRSGKTTIARSLEPEWVRVCPDDIRLASHGEQFVEEKEPLVWSTANLMARALLIGGRAVVVDATNITRKKRRSWVRLAKEFGITLDIYQVETPYRVCVSRNTGAGAVPPEVLERMHRHYERPTTDEGRILVQEYYQP
ncbi:MAG: AAA family ATPase [Ktedonobacterales bacterium]